LAHGAGTNRKSASACAPDAGDLRAVELGGHPFFVGTLFQPERAALKGEPVPIVNAFLEAIRARCST
jgi:CTP synthase (UTP-ammonia lyase)